MSRKFEIIILFLFIVGMILLSQGALAAMYTESLNLSYITGNASTSAKTGWLLTPNVNFTLYQVDQWSSSGYTAIYLYDSGQTRLLDSGVCTGVSCVFSNTSNTLLTGSTYYLMGDKNGSAYTYSYNTSSGFPYSLISFNITGAQNNGGTANVTNEIMNWRTFYINTTTRNNAPVLTISVNDSRTSSLVSGFTVNITNSTYSKTLSTSGTSVSITANSLNATNSSLTLSLNNASFFNGSYRDTSPNAILATLNGKTLNHGPIVNAATGGITINSSGKYGNSLQFDGTSGEKIFPIVNNFNISSPYTICAWATRFQNDTSNMMLLFGVSSTNFSAGIVRFFIGSSNKTATLFFNLSGNVVGSPSGTLTMMSRNYNYYCVGYNGSVIFTASNATIDYASGYTSSIDTLVNFSVGPTIGSVLELNGTIDELRFWNASLSQSEIQAEMNSAYPVRGANLVASYSFELNNITAGATSNWTADTNYLVNGSVNGTGAYYFDGTSKSNLTVISSAISFNLSNDYSVVLSALSLPSNNPSQSSFIEKWSGSPSTIGYPFSLRAFTNGKSRVLIYNGSNALSIDSTNNINDSSWHQHVIIKSGTNLSYYIDRVYQNSINITLTGDINNSMPLGIGSRGGASQFFNGSISNVRVYSRALSAAEVLDLYNGVDLGTGTYNLSFTGVGSNQYFNFTSLNVNWSSQGTDGAGNTAFYGQDWSNYINFTLSNVVNGTGIRAFTVTVSNGSVVSTSSTTTSSLILYNIIGNLTINYTSIGMSTSYFNQSFTLNNFNQSNYNYTNTTYQALLNISTYQLFTNNTISQFNVTNDQAKNNTPSNNYAIIPANNGTNNIQIDVTGNYSQNYTCTVSTPLTTTYCDATGIYDNIFSFSANDTYNNQAILNYTLVINNITIGNPVYNRTTTNGSLNLTLLQGYTYFVQFTTPNGSYEYQNISLPANASNNYYQFNVLPSPSINITIRDASNGALITQNITIVLTSNSTGQIVYTTTGGYFATNIQPDTYSIKLYNTNYSQQQYMVTATSGSVYYLTAYLQQNTSTVIMQFVDSIASSIVLPNTLVSQQLIVNGTWQTISTRTTDITGRTTFGYLNGVLYRFTAITPGYQTKQFDLDPVLFNTYTIKMTRTTIINFQEDYQNIYMTYTPNTFYNNQNNYVNLTFNSPTGLFTSYNYTITYPGGTTNGGGTNAVGATLTTNFTITGATYFDKVTINMTYTINSIPRNFSFQNPITLNNTGTTFADNKNNTYGLGLLDRAIIGTIIILIAAGLMSLAGGGLFGLIMALFIMGTFVYIGFWEWWLAGISFLIGFVIAARRST